MHKQAESFEESARQSLAIAEDIRKELAELEPLPDTVNTEAIQDKVEVAVLLGIVMSSCHRPRQLLSTKILAMRSPTCNQRFPIGGEIGKSSMPVSQNRCEAAEMPDPRMSLHDDVVTFNGTPFEQCSDARTHATTLNEDRRCRLERKLHVLRKSATDQMLGSESLAMCSVEMANE